MTDAENIETLSEFELPFHRKGSLKAVTYVGGLEMVRLTLQERKRFTMVDFDPASAEMLGRQLLEWAEAQKE